MDLSVKSSGGGGFDSFKTAAGITTAANSTVLIGLLAYTVKKVNELGSQFAVVNTNIEQIARKTAEVDQKTGQLATALGKLNDSMIQFNKFKGELIESINELHHSKASTEQRIEYMEKYLDIIISALEEKDIKIQAPRQAPVSRFGRKHVNADSQDRKVAFRKNKNEEDEEEEEPEQRVRSNKAREGEPDETEEDEDLEALKVLKKYREKKDRIKEKKKKEGG